MTDEDFETNDPMKIDQALQQIVQGQFKQQDVKQQMDMRH